MSNKKKIIILLVTVVLLVSCNILVIYNYCKSNSYDANKNDSKQKLNVNANSKGENENSDSAKNEDKVDLIDSNDINNTDVGTSNDDLLIDDNDSQNILPDSSDYNYQDNSKTNTNTNTTNNNTNDNQSNQQSNINDNNKSSTTNIINNNDSQDTNTDKNDNNNDNNSSSSQISESTDFYYSITGGIKEYLTSDECLQAGEQIALQELDDVMTYNEQHMDNQIDVDINYYRCLPVQDENGTGWFLNIFCNSGNCNEKYK